MQKTKTLDIKTPAWGVPLLQPKRYKGAYGGRGCVHPDTLIDTPNGKIKIKDFQGGQVYSWNRNKRVVAVATKPKEYTEEELFEVKVGDKFITVTDEHKFLTPFGWKELRDLSMYDGVVVYSPQDVSSHLRSNSVVSLLESREDGRNLIQKFEDFLGNCSKYHHLYDQQLPLVEGIFQSFLLLLDDVRLHILRVSIYLDDFDSVYKDILCKFSCLHSTLVALLLIDKQHFESKGNYIFSISFELLLRFFRFVRQYLENEDPSLLDQGLSELLADCGKKKDQAQIALKVLETFLPDVSYMNPFLTSSVDNPYIISQIGFIRKRGRQKYWDLHVFGTNNYLSNGIVNHNSGKSHFFAEMMIEKALMKPGFKAVGIREIQKSIQFSVKELLVSKIKQFGVEKYFDVQDKMIKTPGDGMIIFQGMQNHTSDSIKSLEGFDVFWAEEAQSLSHMSLKKLRPTLRASGSEFWATWNPQNEDDAIDLFLRHPDVANDPDFCVVKVNWSDNPWFPRELELERQIDLKRNQDDYAWVWEGAYLSRSDALVFRNWKVEEFDTPNDARFYFGADFGYKDPATLIRLYVIGKTIYIDYEAYRVQCPIEELPKLYATVPESADWQSRADSSRPDTIRYLQDHGFPRMVPCTKGPNSIKEGVEFLQSYDIVIHPRCKHAIQEFSRYKYKIDPKTEQILNEFEDKENHIIDPCRYALEMLRKNERMQNTVSIFGPRVYY